MMVWMLVVTGKAFRKAGLDVSTSVPGSRGQDLAGKLPPRALWPGHNYSHLTEQPTIFYVAVLILGACGGSDVDLALAWGYVALRICHSVWQASINTLPARFVLFALSSLMLCGLVIRALILTMH